jgi:hypothetical protein
MREGPWLGLGAPEPVREARDGAPSSAWAPLAPPPAACARGLLCPRHDPFEGPDLDRDLEAPAERFEVEHVPAGEGTLDLVADPAAVHVVASRATATRVPGRR